jgi:hypothetical protein
MKHPGHTYGGFVPAILERGMTYMKPRWLLQPLSIPEWKWDDISMDFIVDLPLTDHKFDSIWVIVDQLSKSAHFIPVHTRYDAQKYVEIYITRVL